MKKLTELTEREIDALPASPDTDALVAAIVMGLTVETTEEECSYLTPGAIWSDGGQYYFLPVRWAYPPNQDEPEEEDYLKGYSTDIGAAWLVVEKMAEQEKYLNMGNIGWNGPLYYALSISSFYAEAPTAPLAICKAALKAVRAMRLRDA